MTTAASELCAEVEQLLHPFLDGEFGDADRVRFEEHLAACPRCARRAGEQAAFKARLRAAVPHPPLPDGLRARIEQALAREPGTGTASGWKTAVKRAAPLAAAAGLVLALAGTSHRFSPVAAEAISNHRLALPIEVAGSPDQVTSWFLRKVDFPVRPPQLPGATLVGARLGHIRDRRAAYLFYNVSGNRVSVFLFDPSNLPLDARRRRTAAGHDVFLDDQRGYHVALLRNGGLGYAVASDLDEEHIFQLVSSTISR